MNLFEIQKQYQEIFSKMEELSENPENENVENIEELFLKLSENEELFKDKIKNTGFFVKNKESENEAIEKEIKRLQIRKKRNENIINRMENYISLEMKSRGFEKLKFETLDFGFRKSSSVDIIELSGQIDKLLPSNEIIESIIDLKEFKEFTDIKISFSVDKMKLKSILKDKEIPGAFIQQKETLQIK